MAGNPAALPPLWRKEVRLLREAPCPPHLQQTERRARDARADALEQAAAELEAALAPATSPLMTLYASPSGRLHKNRGCTAGGPAARMTEVKLDRDTWAEADRCRCALAWFPDLARQPGPWREGYLAGKEDAFRGKPERSAAQAGRRMMMPAEWWDGYHHGWTDRTADMPAARTPA